MTDKPKVGDRITLNGNGRHTGRTCLKDYASGVVSDISSRSNGFLVKFDNGHCYWVSSHEKYEVDKPIKVVFT